MSFITTHLIEKIHEQVEEKIKYFSYLNCTDNFFWFDDEVITSDGKIIDRIKRYHPYIKDHAVSSSWYLMKGIDLKEIYFKIRDNKFYIKMYNGNTEYKIRVEDNNV